MNKVDFKTSAYFPSHIIIGGILFGLLGLALLLSNAIAGAILCFVSLVLVTTHYRISVDLDKKVYHDYLWILGLKNGEKGKFDSLEYIFIKKSNVSQAMHMRVASSTIQKEVFDGYLKLSEHHKIHLLTMDGKEGLIKKLKTISGQLNLNVIDYSEGAPKEI